MVFFLSSRHYCTSPVGYKNIIKPFIYLGECIIILQYLCMNLMSDFILLKTSDLDN